MRIGILGTGDVGQALGRGFVVLGHEVKMGSRSPDNASAAEWVATAGERASQGTFADATEFAYLTGWRKGQISKLAWEHVDRTNRLLFVPGRIVKNREPQTIPLADIIERAPSAVSMMPAGLLNTLTEEEILDLLAYVLLEDK